MQVLKFGGTSVGSPDSIKKVIKIVTEKAKQEKTVVVVSAFSGITDLLIDTAKTAASGIDQYKNRLQDIEARHINAAKELIAEKDQQKVIAGIKKYCNEIENICNGLFLLRELSLRTNDRIISYGEILSSFIISSAITDSTLKDARELIRTNSNFGQAAVDFISTRSNIQIYFNSNNGSLFIVPGFIAADAEGTTTTLGRGGSDYTAAIIAAGADASMVEIWTDVSGMMTADPRLVTNAKPISHISYHEAMELSHFGAKVIYPPTIQPVMNKKIPVWIKNTFAPDDFGTLIENETSKGESNVRGISSVNKIALINLEGSGMVGIPGFSKRLFGALATEKVNVMLITQSSSEHSICVGIEETAVQKAKQAVDTEFEYEINTGKVDPLIIERDLAIVAIVGDNMKSHPGTTGRMFSTLGRNGVNIRAIAQGASERNISAVISVHDVKKAINVLHERFFEKTYKQINIFIAGTGNVGAKLLSQITQQLPYLQDQLRLQLRITGMANSKKMFFNDEGINPADWKTELNKGEPLQLDKLTETIVSKNLRNTLFVDVTANENVAGVYESLLKKSISVVACNKIACSSEYNHYRKLKDTASEYNALFLFETNVGAGLPVIGTLNDLLKSGDKINSIEAVLSGTLNFVFNNYDGKKSFSEVVKQAQDEGYTEPDPRLDLSGKDVMRKIMILAREAGAKLEMDDITNNSFMPEACMKGSVESFYHEMKNHEAHFKKLFDDANAKGKKLKFVAQFKNGEASVGLQQIDPQHDFYHLYGKDNIVILYTDRYKEQPLVIKGAGAGADVTASGVFADIIRVAR